MRDIQLELYESRVRGFENRVDMLRALADGVHVVVVAQRHTDIRRTLAQLGQEFSEFPAILQRRFSRVRFQLIEDLKIKPPGVSYEAGIGRMFTELAG